MVMSPSGGAPPRHGFFGCNILEMAAEDLFSRPVAGAAGSLIAGSHIDSPTRFLFIFV
jgi:hypothetical protein